MVKKLAKDLIHEPLKHGMSISQTLQHHPIFIIAGQGNAVFH